MAKNKQRAKARARARAKALAKLDSGKMTAAEAKVKPNEKDKVKLKSKKVNKTQASTNTRRNSVETTIFAKNLSTIKPQSKLSAVQELSLSLENMNYPRFTADSSPTEVSSSMSSSRSQQVSPRQRITTNKTSWDDLPFEIKSTIVRYLLHGTMARGLNKMGFISDRIEFALVPIDPALHPKLTWLHLDICDVAVALPEIAGEVFKQLRQLKRSVEIKAQFDRQEDERILLSRSLQYLWDCQRLMRRDLDLGYRLNGEWLRRTFVRTDEQERWEHLIREEGSRRGRPDLFW